MADVDNKHDASPTVSENIKNALFFQEKYRKRYEFCAKKAIVIVDFMQIDPVFIFVVVHSKDSIVVHWNTSKRTAWIFSSFVLTLKYRNGYWRQLFFLEKTW